jgi:hypothetical protein
MDIQKVENALEELKQLGYITKYDGSYKFTEAGHNYTRKASRNSWIFITQYRNSSLWVRRVPRRNDSWAFTSIERVTEEQFEDFCKYFNIKAEGPLKLVICDEVEFMDI